jgi:O-acetyl-ADP-ribose deacetylase (regulator of RNase III)
MEWHARVTLEQGDISEAPTDAIVNAANNDLLLGAGVAGAIRAKGGPQIQQECDRIGPIEVGEAAITTAGRLKARFVIHAASMRLGGRTDEDGLRNSTRNTLRIAAQRGLNSIAFPAIGTGIAGFPLGRCAEVMLAEIRDHLQVNLKPEQVRIVLFDLQALNEFTRVFETMKSKSAKAGPS